MLITREVVAAKLTAYLQGHVPFSELVSWAEDVMQEGDFAPKDSDTLREIVSNLGLADVKAFGLEWEDCNKYLNRLGYVVQIKVSPQT